MIAATLAESANLAVLASCGVLWLSAPASLVCPSGGCSGGGELGAVEGVGGGGAVGGVDDFRLFGVMKMTDAGDPSLWT